MPYCARLGCPILLGITDDHAFCFGHRDCSTQDPCEICETWTLRTTHTLHQAYREQTRRPFNRMMNYPPPTMPYNTGRGRGRTPSAALSAPPGLPPVPANTGEASCPPSSLANLPERRSQQPPVPPVQTTSTPYIYQQHPVLLDFPPPTSQVRQGPLYSYYRPEESPPRQTQRDTSVPLSPLSPVAAIAPPPPPSSTPPLDLCERRLDQAQREILECVPDQPGPVPQPENRIPWTRRLVLPPSRPRRRRAPKEDWNMEIDGEEDPNVLSLSTTEQLDSSEVVRPATRRASPFPGISWSELEMRAALLITEIMPNRVIAEPPSSQDFYSSCPPATSNRPHFQLAPAVTRELETISTYLNSSRSTTTPSLSLSRPYPWQAMWWVPASQFPVHHPNPEPDTELLVASNPRVISSSIEAFTRRADLLRSILVCSSENALLQEAAFQALGNLRHTSGAEHDALVENISMAMSVACRRTDSTIQMATRGVAMDTLAHRDAILDASQVPLSRRRQLRAVDMRGETLFNGALAPLRQVLLPTAPATVAPPAAPAAAAVQPTASQPRFSPGARPWSSRGGRRPPANGRSYQNRRGNSSGSSQRGSSSAQSRSNKRGGRK